MRNINNQEDMEKIQAFLQDYTRIFEKHVHLLPKGIGVKYINSETGELHHGGIILKCENNYLLLKKPIIDNNIIWNVDIAKNIIFVEDIEKRKKEQEQKKNLFKLYNAGLIKLVDNKD